GLGQRVPRPDGAPQAVARPPPRPPRLDLPRGRPQQGTVGPLDRAGRDRGTRARRDVEPGLEVVLPLTQGEPVSSLRSAAWIRARVSCAQSSPTSRPRLS